MEIRKAQLCDLVRIQAIGKHTVDKEYRDFLSDENVDFFITDFLDDYLSKNLDNIFVVWDEVIVGFAVCKKNLIDFMLINHHKHGLGYGAFLLEYCEKKLFEEFFEIRLESFDNNEKANKFYLKNSWEILKKEHDSFINEVKIIFVKKR